MIGKISMDIHQLRFLRKAFINKWNDAVKKDEIEFSEFKKEARIMGNLCNDLGGKLLMIVFHDSFPQHFQRLVEISWDGIGEWLG